jgi:hypothetical protein
MPRKRLCAAVALAALGSCACPAGSLATPSPECAVANSRDRLSYLELQEAVNAALPGDTLKVKGTCYGDAIVDFDLTIGGQGAATLNGANSSSAPGTVLTVGGGATVAVAHLTIKGGHASQEFHEAGAGIHVVGSTLTLTSSTVLGNVTEASRFDASGTAGGGGIYNEGGTVSLVASHVTGNTGLGAGGGILNSGTLTLESSTVSLNTAVYSNRGELEETAGGGIANAPGASATLTNSTVTENHSGAPFGCNSGGGIANGGSLTLNGSRVSANVVESVCGQGGGIDNTGMLALNASSVIENSAGPDEYENDGGGISSSGAGSSVALSGRSLVSRNTAHDGGGLYLAGGALTLSGPSSITRNTAVELGGGVFLAEGATLAFHEWSGKISANHPDNIYTS